MDRAILAAHELANASNSINEIPWDEAWNSLPPAESLDNPFESGVTLCKNEWEQQDAADMDGGVSEAVDAGPCWEVSMECAFLKAAPELAFVHKGMGGTSMMRGNSVTSMPSKPTSIQHVFGKSVSQGSKYDAPRVKEEVVDLPAHDFCRPSVPPTNIIPVTVPNICHAIASPPGQISLPRIAPSSASQVFCTRSTSEWNSEFDISLGRSPHTYVSSSPSFATISTLPVQATPRRHDTIPHAAMKWSSPTHASPQFSVSKSAPSHQTVGTSGPAPFAAGTTSTPFQKHASAARIDDSLLSRQISDLLAAKKSELATRQSGGVATSPVPENDVLARQSASVGSATTGVLCPPRFQLHHDAAGLDRSQRPTTKPALLALFQRHLY